MEGIQQEEMKGLKNSEFGELAVSENL